MLRPWSAAMVAASVKFEPSSTMRRRAKEAKRIARRIRAKKDDEEYEAFMLRMEEEFAHLSIEYWSAKKFASYLGINGTNRISSWMQSGMPRGDGDKRFLIPKDAAIKWCIDNGLPRNAPPIGAAPKSDYISPKEFMAIHDITRDKLGALIDLGLPAAYNGWIDKQQASDWMLDNANMLASRHRGKSSICDRDAITIETRTMFAVRCGVTLNAVNKWIGRGLPCVGSKKDIDIAGGLAWVSQNKKAKVTHP